MRVDDRGQKHEAMIAAGKLGRQLDHPRQDARGLHHGDAGAAPERILAGQLHRKVQALVEDAREGVRRIQPDGREHRHDLSQEVGLDPVALLFGPVPAPEEADAGAGERRQQVLVPQAVLGGYQLVRDARYVFEHARRQLAVRAGDVGADFDLRLEARHPDLEELVQVAADDAQEAQALQQRHAEVSGLRQDAPVELEQTELAIEVVLRKGTLRHGRPGSGRGECRVAATSRPGRGWGATSRAGRSRSPPRHPCQRSSVQSARGCTCAPWGRHRTGASR